MTLKHPKNSSAPTGDLSVAPHFNLETTTIPRHALPDGEMRPQPTPVHDEASGSAFAH